MLKFLTNTATYETIIRYLLGLGLLPYGLTKIARTQFVVLPFYTWSEPLKDISGTTLTWAFLGYSPWFTVLLGLLETVPAVLLLFRKTKLIGSLLLFPVVLNVFLINMALDLWTSTQRISALFLAMNVVLLLFHYPLLRKVFIQVFDHAQIRNKRIGLEVLVNVLLVGTVAGLSIYELADYVRERNILTGDWYNQRPNCWLIEDSLQYYTRLKRADINERDYTRYYFQPYQSAYRVSPGNSQPVYSRYELDEQKHTLTMYDSRDSSRRMKGFYEVVNENTIQWNLLGKERRKLWLSRQPL